MGKAEDKRAAIVAAQAAREAGERAARGTSSSARLPAKRSPSGRCGGDGLRNRKSDGDSRRPLRGHGIGALDAGY